VKVISEAREKLANELRVEFGSPSRVSKRLFPKPVVQPDMEGSTRADLHFVGIFRQDVRVLAHGEGSHRPLYAAVGAADRPRNSTQTKGVGANRTSSFP
jgi:hypothetical protein